MIENSDDPALALIELSSIARGYPVADAMVKRAPVVLTDCRPVSPGKFLVLVTGDVASVDEAFRAGLAIAGDRIVDRLFLPQAHPLIGPAVRGAIVAPAPRSSRSRRSRRRPSPRRSWRPTPP